MRANIPTLIPNRIDRDPPIIRGITAPEIYTVLGIGLAAGIFSALFFGLIAKTFFFGMVAAIIIFVLTLVFGVLLTADIKRGKPLNYLTHKRHIAMEKMGMGRAPFIHKTTRFRTER